MTTNDKGRTAADCATPKRDHGRIIPAAQEVGNVVAKYFCYCGHGVTTCICCLAWNRLIRRHEARRKAWGTDSPTMTAEA